MMSEISKLCKNTLMDFFPLKPINLSQAMYIMDESFLFIGFRCVLKVRCTHTAHKLITRRRQQYFNIPAHSLSTFFTIRITSLTFLPDILPALGPIPLQFKHVPILPANRSLPLSAFQYSTQFRLQLIYSLTCISICNMFRSWNLHHPTSNVFIVTKKKY